MSMAPYMSSPVQQDLVLPPPDAVLADGWGRSPAETSAAYLNSDERGGAPVADKPSFTIERAAKQLTGFDPVTVAPYPG